MLEPFVLTKDDIKKDQTIQWSHCSTTSILHQKLMEARWTGMSHQNRIETEECTSETEECTTSEHETNKHNTEETSETKQEAWVHDPMQQPLQWKRRWLNQCCDDTSKFVLDIEDALQNKGNDSVIKDAIHSGCEGWSNKQLQLMMNALKTRHEKQEEKDSKNTQKKKKWSKMNGNEQVEHVMRCGQMSIKKHDNHKACACATKKLLLLFGAQWHFQRQGSQQLFDHKVDPVSLLFASVWWHSGDNWQCPHGCNQPCERPARWLQRLPQRLLQQLRTQQLTRMNPAKEMQTSGLSFTVLRLLLMWLEQETHVLFGRSHRANLLLLQKL